MLKDVRGVEIEVGDFVAYPGRSGSSLWLSCAKVTAIDEYEPAAKGGKLSLLTMPGLKNTHTRALHRVVVIEKARLPVTSDGASYREPLEGESEK